MTDEETEAWKSSRSTSSKPPAGERQTQDVGCSAGQLTARWMAKGMRDPLNSRCLRRERRRRRVGAKEKEVGAQSRHRDVRSSPPSPACLGGGLSARLPGDSRSFSICVSSPCFQQEGMPVCSGCLRTTSPFHREEGLGSGIAPGLPFFDQVSCQESFGQRASCQLSAPVQSPPSCPASFS